MLNFSTLTLATTSTSKSEQIFLIILLICYITASALCLVGFLYIIENIIVDITKYKQNIDEDMDEDIDIKYQKPIITFIIILLIVVNIIALYKYLGYSKNERYIVKVEIQATNLNFKTPHSIKKFPDKLVKEGKNGIFTTPTNIGKNYHPKETKLIKEKDKIYFTTKLKKQSYHRYKNKKEFRHDLETMAEYLIKTAQTQ